MLHRIMKAQVDASGTIMCDSVSRAPVAASASSALKMMRLSAWSGQAG